LERIEVSAAIPLAFHELKLCYRQHQSPCKGRRWAAAQGRSEMMHDMIGPGRSPGPWRELAKLKAERDILKKAAAYFASGVPWARRRGRLIPLTGPWRCRTVWIVLVAGTRKS
jgi:hypothetical protein